MTDPKTLPGTSETVLRLTPLLFWPACMPATPLKSNQKASTWEFAPTQRHSRERGDLRAHGEVRGLGLVPPLEVGLLVALLPALRPGTRAGMPSPVTRIDGLID